ncbi:MAG TPA: hypothetical protein VKE22_23965 [Haliangiales bacterium]|nr:hypothetical protein [Haliangiales bacterium]
MSDIGPPPGAVHELAEQAVDFVRRATGVALDYTAETLPVLDHYLREVPRDRTELVGLVATASGAYFGEVVRRRLGGLWDTEGDEPREWRLTVGHGLTFSPVGVAAEAIVRADSEEGVFEVPEEDRPAVEAALDEEVSEDEYYSLAGRLEVFERIAEVLLAARVS